MEDDSTRVKKTAKAGSVESDLKMSSEKDLMPRERDLGNGSACNGELNGKAWRDRGSC